MKITIYELLGLIKDGKAPKKIKYRNSILEFATTNYVNNNTGLVVFGFSMEELDDEVEIIEEQDELLPKHITNEFIQGLDNQDIKHIVHKVNEIINYLQHKSKED